MIVGVYLRNIGRGVARDIRVHDLRLSPEGTRHPIVMQWNALDYIAPEQQRELSGHPTQDGQALPDAEGLWRSNFGPHGRPEYEFVIEYNDVAGNGYRTRFRLFHGGVATLLADERSR